MVVSFASAAADRAEYRQRPRNHDARQPSSFWAHSFRAQPLERDPGKVLDEVLDGFITPDQPRDDQGVLLEAVIDGYGWMVDPQGTRDLWGRVRAR